MYAKNMTISKFFAISLSLLCFSGTVYCLTGIKYILRTKLYGEVRGTIRLLQIDQEPVEIKGRILGCEPGKLYELWLHTRGDIRNNCSVTGGFFKPPSKYPEMPWNTVGLYPNIFEFECNTTGKLTRFLGKNKKILLAGSYSLAGRSIVVHLKRTNDVWSPCEDIPAGKRMSCGILGIGHHYPWDDGNEDVRPRKYERF